MARRFINPAFISALVATTSASAFPWMAALPAAVQPAQPVEANPSSIIDDLVGELGSADPDARTQASVDLKASPSIRLKDIEKSLSRQDLNAEQVRRLMDACEYRFMLEPRAAVGVTYNPMAQDREGIVIVEAIEPTFPAAAVIKPGDRIEAIDGVRLSAASPMRPVIFSRDPGDEIPMTIVRDGVTLNVIVKLGEWSKLQSLRVNNRGGFRGMDINDADLEQAWRYRSARYEQGREWRVIDVRAPRHAAENPHDEFEFNRGAVDENEWEVEPSTLMAGGQAHGGLGRETPTIVARARQTQVDRLAVENDPAGLQRALERHMLQIRQIDLAQQDIRRKLMRPGLSPADRRDLQQAYATNENTRIAYMQEIQGIQSQIQMLELGAPMAPRRRR